METAIKLGMLLIGAIGAAKLLYETIMRRRSHMWDRFRFTKEFLDELKADPQMHPLIREQGFKAIAGDSTLTAAEVEYLISLKNPEASLRDYALGRYYLEHLPEIHNLQVAFKNKYKKPFARQCRTAAHLLLYFSSLLLIFAPIMFMGLLKLSPDEATKLFMLLFLMMGHYAWLSLRSAVRIMRASKLVESQEKYPERK